MLIAIRWDGQCLTIQAQHCPKEEGMLAPAKSRPSTGRKKKLSHHMGGQKSAPPGQGNPSSAEDLGTTLLKGRPSMRSTILQLGHHGGGGGHLHTQVPIGGNKGKAGSTQLFPKDLQQYTHIHMRIHTLLSVLYPCLCILVA